MKNTIRIIGLVAAIITITTSLLYLIFKIMIPGLGPLSLSIVMLSLVYSAREQHKSGKVKLSYWRFMLYVGGLGVVANLIAGISQIFNAINK